MIMKNFKKTILIFMFFALCLMFTGSVVRAEETCTTYKNYYFFTMITSAENTFSQPAGVGKLAEGTAYFRKIANSTDITWSDVCLYNSENPDRCTGEGEKMSLDVFYGKTLDALDSNREPKVTVDGKDYIVYVSIDDTAEPNTVISYLAHTKWVKSNGEDSPGVNLKGKTPANLIKATIWPETSIYGPGGATTSYRFTVSRTSVANMTSGVTPYSFAWTTGGDSIPNLFAPAAKMAKYTICKEGERDKNEYEVEKDPSAEPEKEDEPTDGTKKKYTATIKYLNSANRKQVALSYEKEFYDGEGETVTSPTVSGCVPDMKSVTFKIDGDNYNKTVWYNCTVNGNSQTGTVMFVVCMIIGFSCLAYFLYYVFVGRKKVNNDI